MDKMGTVTVSTKAPTTPAGPSISSGLQNALTLPVLNISKVEVCTVTLQSASLLNQLKVFPSTPKNSLRKLHAHYVFATTKITRPRYSMRLEAPPRASTTMTYLQSTSKCLPSISVTRAMKHCGYANPPDGLSLVRKAYQMPVPVRLAGTLCFRAV